MLGMNTADLLSAIDSEIARLQEARALLAGTGSSIAKRGRPAKYTMSAEGRARIAAAQRARWAKQKKVANKAA
jgi:fructoselysine-6-P-deglycase FrlB-like protein